MLLKLQSIQGPGARATLFSSASVSLRIITDTWGKGCERPKNKQLLAHKLKFNAVSCNWNRKSYLKFQAAFRVEPLLMIGCIDIMDASCNNEHIQYIYIQYIIRKQII